MRERELALYTDRREYDPEGLYYYGQALERERPRRGSSRRLRAAPSSQPGLGSPVPAGDRRASGVAWRRRRPPTVMSNTRAPIRHTVTRRQRAAPYRHSYNKGHVPGVYLSYPFCAQKCTYCNFASGVFPRELEARYLDALRAGDLARTPGSGTPKPSISAAALPAACDPDALRDLLDLIPGRPWIEATLEAAPGTITPEKARAPGSTPASTASASACSPSSSRNPPHRPQAHRRDRRRGHRHATRGRDRATSISI